MMTDLCDFLNTHLTIGPDAAQALALVAATVDLPPATATALCLVCRATRRAIDGKKNELEITDKELKFWADHGLSGLNSTLTTGLTAFSCKIESGDGDFSNVFQTINACIMAAHNSKSLEVLKMDWKPLLRTPNGVIVVRSAIASLGIRGWPRLRKLFLRISPTSLCTLFNPHTMNSFTALRALSLLGNPSAADVATLSSLETLCSKLKTLSLALCFKGGDSASQHQMARLLKSLHSVSDLELNLGGATSLDFFIDAELPSLQVLKFLTMPGISLDPLVRLERPQLRSLTVHYSCGISVDAYAKLGPVLSSPHALPNLKIVNLQSLHPSDWSILSEMKLSTVTSLRLYDCCLSPDDVAYLALAVAQLPALEYLTLEAIDCDEDDEIDWSHDGAKVAMQHLLSGTGLKNLRQLVVGGAWEDNDESLAVLIERADALPKLKKIAFGAGSFTQRGIEALLKAGQRGKMPDLASFIFRRLELDEEADCDVVGTSKMLMEVWPGLEMKVGSNAAAAAVDENEEEFFF